MSKEKYLEQIDIAFNDLTGPTFYAGFAKKKKVSNGKQQMLFTHKKDITERVLQVLFDNVCDRGKSALNVTIGDKDYELCFIESNG